MIPTYVTWNHRATEQGWTSLESSFRVKTVALRRGRTAPVALILRDRTFYLPMRPPLRPGFPGVPPRSSFDRLGSPWFELPGSQFSGPLPTP